MKEQRQQTRTDRYSVRQYEPGDREAFLALYSDVFGKERDADWFEWRYDGPYVSDVPMTVAERAGELVGALPFIGLRLRAGPDAVLALQPADAMVHADHRRHGLLTRMTERALNYYGPREPEMFFNFPNDAVAPAFLKLGWVDVGHIPTHYRLLNASAFVGDGSGASRIAARRLASACFRAYVGVRDRGGTTADVSVERYDSAPAEALTSLYEAGVPSGLHAVRDGGFYRWRLANPYWDATTYLARRDGRVVAGVVVCTQSTRGITVAKLLDAVPMTGQGRRRASFDALVSAVVADSRDGDVDVVAAADGTLPRDLLARRGFLRDDAPPLSWRSTVTQLIARPLPGDGTSSAPGSLDLADPTDWSLTFAEQDTAY